MSDLDELEGDVRVLEAHVLGQEQESPGLLMRMDRVERLMELQLKIVSWCGGIGAFTALAALVWKALEVLAQRVSHTP